MSEDPCEETRARKEAAAWFSRLSRPAITTEALWEFRDWRCSPENFAAYAEIEALWRRARALTEDSELRETTCEELYRRTPQLRHAEARRRSARMAVAFVCAVSLAAGVIAGLAQRGRTVRR
jgi:ferric-dicitrate binding protein FerR (iron transport regulator)